MRGDFFSGTTAPRAPADLKERALRAARATAHDTSQPDGQAWGFTGFDMVWVAALLLLLLCHALLPASRRPSPLAAVEAKAGAEAGLLEKELGLKGVPMVFAEWDTARNGDAQRRLMEEVERL
jgi:hypothetical protein